MALQILADEDIPLARELFGSLGEVTLVPGREITPSHPGLAGAHVLAIRSVTRVRRPLLDRAASLMAIGTATIGTDHIDLAAVAEANRTRRQPIAVFSAPGSNADSVADFVWHAVLHVTEGAGRPFCEMSLGIVGCGNCGTRVGRRAAGFGMRVMRCDPPLAERDPSFTSDALADALGADVVTLHVPLTTPGRHRHPTYHMVGAAELARMGEGAFLVNTARGAVVDSPALIAALRGRQIGGAVLDVYEGEPEPPAELVELATIATPHVAGYAVEGKRRGAVAVYLQVCELLGVAPMDTRDLLRGGFVPALKVRVAVPLGPSLAVTADGAARRLLAAAHDLPAVSRALKATLSLPNRGEAFDAMRRDYERVYGRHELSVYGVEFDESVEPALRAAVAQRVEGFGMAVGAAEPHFVLCRA